MAIGHPNMTTKAMLKPDELGAYLDGVRPSMAEIEGGMRVNVCDVGNYLKVVGCNDYTCLVQVELPNGRPEWIRVEQIEYVYPY